MSQQINIIMQRLLYNFWTYSILQLPTHRFLNARTVRSRRRRMCTEPSRRSQRRPSTNWREKVSGENWKDVSTHVLVFKAWEDTVRYDYKQALVAFVALDFCFFKKFRRNKFQRFSAMTNGQKNLHEFWFTDLLPCVCASPPQFSVCSGSPRSSARAKRSRSPSWRRCWNRAQIPWQTSARRRYEVPS